MNQKTEKPLNIYQRVNEVRKKIDYVKKDKKVQNYQAVTHDAVTAGIRRHLIDQSIIVEPSLESSKLVETSRLTSGGTPILRYEAIFYVFFVNADNPDDKIKVRLEAHADDTGDKAPGKALSYATKAAILKLFSIETGESEESRVEGVNKQAFDVKEAIEKYDESISKIIEYLATNDLESAAEVYNEIPKEEKMKLWIAPRTAKELGIDPPFSTRERAQLKSDDFGRYLRELKEKTKADDGEL